MRSVSFPYKSYRGTQCPIVTVGLQGPLGWINAEAYVDSGAFISIFTLNEAAGLGLDYLKGQETFVTVGDGGLIPVYVHNLLMQVGPSVISANVGFSPRLGVGFNLLGRQDLFMNFDVTFSDSRKMVYFQKLSR